MTSLQTTFCVELETAGDAASESPQAHAAGPHPLRQLVLRSHTYHLRTHTFHKYGLNDAFDRSVSLALQVVMRCWCSLCKLVACQPATRVLGSRCYPDVLLPHALQLTVALCTVVTKTQNSAGDA